MTHCHLSKTIVSDLISSLDHSPKALRQYTSLGHLTYGYFEFPRVLTYADVAWGFAEKVLSLYCMNKISHVSKQRGMCLSRYLSMPAGIWSVWRSAGFIHAPVGLYIHVIKSWIYLGLSHLFCLSRGGYIYFLNFRSSCIPWTEQPDFFLSFFFLVVCYVTNIICSRNVRGMATFMFFTISSYFSSKTIQAI